MKDFIITIARGYGSGGKTIAKALSKRLGIHYYDRELIRMASDDSGINEALFNLADETHKPRPFRKYTTTEILSPENNDFLSRENLFNLQAEIIRGLGNKGESCIIVGRCAHHILKGKPEVVRVFIYADLEHCIENVKEYNGVDEEEARALILKTDKERAQYHKYYTNMTWNDARNYDLCLNTNVLTMDQCVEIIVNYLGILDSINTQKE